MNLKAGFQSFIKGGIPISFPGNVGKETFPSSTITSKRGILLLGVSILTGGVSALLVELLFVIMGHISSFCGLPEEFGVAEEHNNYVLLMPVAVTLIMAGILRYTGKRGSHALQSLWAVLAINAGIPLGLEGPVIEGARAFTDNHRLSIRERKMVAAAAMAGGIAFLYGSPLAAMALMIELMVIEVSWVGITAVILGGAAGGVLHYWIKSSEPIFTMPPVPVAELSALLGYTATGVLIGLVAMLARKIIGGITGLFHKLPLNKLWWPVIAAVLTGIAGYFTPEVLGAGYEHIDSLLVGKVTLQFLFVLGIGKLLLMAIVLGSGTPGGTIAPLMAIGGSFGLFITFLLQFMFPAVHLNFAVAALVGMAAMLAGGNRVLIAAIFLAIETTHATNALMPVICACTSAWLVNYKLRITNDVSAFRNS